MREKGREGLRRKEGGRREGGRRKEKRERREERERRENRMEWEGGRRNKGWKEGNEENDVCIHALLILGGVTMESILVVLDKIY